MMVHIDSLGALKGLSKTLRQRIDLDVEPVLDRQSAQAVAATAFKAQPSAAPRSELVIYARDLKPVLAWDVLIEGTLSSGLPSQAHLIVNARDGRLLDRWDDIQTADALGSGTGFYTGTVPLHGNQKSDGSFELVDLTRGGQTITDMNNKGNVLFGGPRGTVMTDDNNVWGSGTSTDRDTAGVDAAYGIGKTWDYYKQVFGRDGIADDGRGAEGRVHWARKLVNASWNDSCFCMRYGDGDGVETGSVVSLDVAGHEMTHGVTSRTARLTYSRESGGLNEATSDIFGTMVEFFANNPSSPPNYKIGERIYFDQSAGGAFRYMYQPSLDSPKPSTQSADCWYAAVGQTDVHNSSGVGNHFFYLLAEGSNPAAGPASPTCNAGDTKQATGNVLTKGIGRDAAQKIWYRALTVYMTQNTNYAGARVATVKAATDLFGATSTQTKAVQAAWSAVNVN